MVNLAFFSATLNQLRVALGYTRNGLGSVCMVTHKPRGSRTETPVPTVKGRLGSASRHHCDWMLARGR